ncbi:facilitated trehalose transporter Tret1-2 homolog [Ochlerotatus camptorhynchus]|uniref:facilitated trehalose transporter Tret1-2 homolog n=1 Tax=Ochlerotatus camptorhynchus TaxID=644619 RepID=UPI0031DBEE13
MENSQHQRDRRLGHRDWAAAERIGKEQLATGMQGKASRTPFPEETERKSLQVLDIVYTDLCGPMKTVAPSGNRYVMHIIDDYSRFTVTYLLQHKSEATQNIVDYVRWAENNFGRKPRVVRSDGGGEFDNKRLRKFYLEEGITPQYTTAYSPQSNGVAERKNRLITEMATCMFFDSGLEKRYWGKAVLTATYLQNRLPSRLAKAMSSSFVENNVAGGSARRLPQYIAGLAASGGALAAGTFLGWTAPAEIPLVQKAEYGFPITTEQFSWIGSMATLGAASMCFPIGIMMKMIGRKWAMLSMVLPLLIGWLLIIFANNVAMLMVGRFFLGVGGGAFSIAAPTYTAEIAQSSIRGTLGTFFQLLVTVGILFTYSIGAVLNVQVLSTICSVVPLAFGLIFPFMPESPHYFIEKNRYNDASKSLKWLRGSHYDERAEIEDLKEEDAKMRADKITFVQVLKQRATIRALIICLGLVFFHQFSGINAIIFYTTTIFTDANTGLEATDATIIVGVIQVVATLLATFIVDKSGRRILLIISGFFMAVSTILLAVYFQLKEDDTRQIENLGWLPLLAVCLFIAMFSIGYGPILWLMIGELFANNVKAYVSPLAGASAWLLAFLVTKIFPNLRDGLGNAGVFWLFSCLSLLGTVFVFFVVPETKGISLAEIQRMLSGENGRLGSVYKSHAKSEAKSTYQTVKPVTSRAK